MPSAQSNSPEPLPAPPQLSTMETAVIDVFVSAVKLIGLPKSVGEIYGLLFSSPSPLTLDSLVRRLSISKGSASQGLKVLRSVGAVRPVYVAGDRRDHYAAETELKKLVAGFIREELQPRLDSGTERLSHLNSLLTSSHHADSAFLSARISKLGQWHARSKAVLPLLTGLLD
jgi:HTH-type transcriptional regulator, glycine betaine synthesis regulator